MNISKFPLLMLAATIAFLSACTSAPESDEAQVGETREVAEADQAAETYMVDTEASVIEWIGTKVTGRHNGIIEISDGKLMVENGELTAGTFTIDMTTIEATDEKMDEDKNGKLTGHLKSDDFFAVETYPEAVFEITGVETYEGQAPAEAEEANTEEIDEYRVTDPTHMISGNLQMKDVTKGISFPAKVEISDGSISAMAKFNIDRSIWNVSYKGAPDDLISNTVHLGIGLEASK